MHFASDQIRRQGARRYLGKSSIGPCRQDAANKSKRSTPTERSQRSKSSSMLKKT